MKLSHLDLKTIMTTKPKTTAKRTTKKVKTLHPETLVALPPNPIEFEEFDHVIKQRTKAKNIEYLKKYWQNSIKSLFIWKF